MKPAKHGRDHCRGGEDPIPCGQAWVEALRTSASQVVTATTELIFDQVRTNARSVFGRASDTAGILIKEPGLYATYAAVRIGAGDIAVARAIYTTVQPNANGPLWGIGSEFAETSFSVGLGQAQAGLGEVTAASTISKSVLNHVGIQRLIEFTEANPMRAAVILQRNTANWTVQGLNSSLVIVQISAGGGTVIT